MINSLIQAGYHHDLENDIWHRNNYESIKYSDGDATENRIKYLIEKADDLSTLSDELRGFCTDWPSAYYLSSYRANLLRVFENSFNGDVLEIGAGCGAITRYLGEQGGHVLALEGSIRRASIARARTKDLPNVCVLAEKFEDFHTDKKFDVITLIGVFEYANLFMSGNTPSESMLLKVRELLKPNGLLILAIENQLGLKYFAGSPEDHVACPMFGIEGRYNKNTPQTYGKKELTSLLIEAGFSSNDFFAPFPDYKLPVSIITQHGFDNQNFDSAIFAQQSVRSDRQLPELLVFSPELAWPQICKNGLGMEMSNSFLIAASPTPREIPAEKTLAFHFSNDRHAYYCKRTDFIEKSNGKIIVKYNKLSHENPPENNGILKFKTPKYDAYIEGRIFNNDLILALNTEGWTFNTIGEYLTLYINILKKISGEFYIREKKLQGELFDAIPQNILIDKENNPNLIDKEWSITQSIKIEFMLFRALRALLSSTSHISSSPETLNLTNKEFIIKSCKAAGYPITSFDIDEFLSIESSVQNIINGRDTSQIFSWGENTNIKSENIFTALDSSKYLLQSKSSALANLEKIHKDTIDSLEAKKAILSACTSELNKLKHEHEMVLNSSSWKLTKPFRITKNKIRNTRFFSREKIELVKRKITKKLRPQKISNQALELDFYIKENPINRTRQITVILPIYRNIEMTKRCIEHAMPGVLSLKDAKIIAINDCSPDPGMQEMLTQLQNRWPGNLIVLENDRNLGFVKTVNRGISQAPEDDIVFLNSDVVVPMNWLERLSHEAYITSSIGTVTPFSNNATICSFPSFLYENEQAFGLTTDQIDSVFSESRLPLIKSPTGVGFCMYVRRDCLNKVGVLNEEKFGRGYGEENDLCQRALKAGWINALTPNLYAFHEGGISFSSSKKDLVDHAVKAIDSLHPNYHQDIQDFIANDPLKSARINRLADLMSTIDRPKVLHISHEAGGGVKQHVTELTNNFDHCSLILTPHRGSQIISLQIGKSPSADHLFFKIPEDTEKLVELFIKCGISFIHYHHSLGLNSILLKLPKQLDIDYAITVHDFYWLCGNPSLTNDKGVYPGQYSDDLPNPDFPLPSGVSSSIWREGFREFIEGAKTIIFPSEFTLSLYQSHYKISYPVVAWHLENKRPLNQNIKTINLKSRYTIGVLGALGKGKGADYLEQLAEIALQRNLPFDFKLIGYAYKDIKNIITTGGYNEDELPNLIENSAFDLILFPAQAPETYSYTLSYALSAGLPIIAPNIGSFPERLSNRKNTLIHNFGISPDELLAEMEKFISSIANGHPIFSNVYNSTHLKINFYTSEYLEIISLKSRKTALKPYFEIPKINYQEKESDPTLTTREIIFLALWRIYKTPTIQKFSRFIPYEIRQKIKRKLTKRPLHEIV